MDTTINEIGQIGYLGTLMALVQLYLDFNLPVTDAILAAEADLVTWGTTNSVSHSMALASRPLDQKTSAVCRHTNGARPQSPAQGFGQL